MGFMTNTCGPNNEMTFSFHLMNAYQKKTAYIQIPKPKNTALAGKQDCEETASTHDKATRFPWIMAIPRPSPESAFGEDVYQPFFGCK
jgi:hypothetical protein